MMQSFSSINVKVQRTKACIVCQSCQVPGLTNYISTHRCSLQVGNIQKYRVLPQAPCLAFCHCSEWFIDRFFFMCASCQELLCSRLVAVRGSCTKRQVRINVYVHTSVKQHLLHCFVIISIYAQLIKVKSSSLFYNCIALNVLTLLFSVYTQCRDMFCYWLILQFTMDMTATKLGTQSEIHVHE